jgi:hypothetical protein
MGRAESGSARKVKRFQTLADRLKRVWRHLRAWLGPRYIPVLCEDLPDQIEAKRVYLVGEDDPWQAAMQCPCGCKGLIQLSLVTFDKPSWQATLGTYGALTLRPSVWRTKGCRAHFVLQDGRIYWC